MIYPRKAPVRPHVTFPGVSGSLLLEDEVFARIEEERWGLVVLTGSSRIGKSVAIAHLAELFGSDPRLHLSDNPDFAAQIVLAKRSKEQLVVCASPHTEPTATLAESWRILPWGQDDWIEYLLNTHRAKCASVMARVDQDPFSSRLSGMPELWRIVLDRLANDDEISCVKAALQAELNVRLDATPITRTFFDTSLDTIFTLNASWRTKLSKQLAVVAPAILSLMQYEVVTTLLLADSVAGRLLNTDIEPLKQPLLPSLVEETAALIRKNASVLEWLHTIMKSLEWSAHATAASLLNAAGESWHPAPFETPLLSGAQLAGLQWKGLQLRFLDIQQADLSRADLSDAVLGRVDASHARLSNAQCHGAKIENLCAPHAWLDGADLSFVRATCADFRNAELQCAVLVGSLLNHSLFHGADLTKANFCRAELCNADFTDAIIEEADFTGANLTSAKLSRLCLRSATWSGAQFTHAVLQECDLECMVLPGADFESANLAGSHLTGSQMPMACFRYANLANTGLAEIEWEGADLREADLRKCTFHLGSSRSGLVDSPIACEGSRTGFYTDELHEQDFKAPEEIRKANLCRADLRGAKLGDVDFYLVDLRGAIYTADQEDHFRRCGAILESRV